MTVGTDYRKTDQKVSNNDMDNAKYKNIWCVVKSVSVREMPKSDSKELGRIKFGKQAVTAIDGIGEVNGRIKVTFRDSTNDNKKKPTITGWALTKAFTEDHFEDYAKLYFDNKTGRKLPVADRYRGKAVGCILPGEQVAMIARFGEWCLTSRGWTKFKWLTKNRDIFDSDGLIYVFYGVLEQAVKDYKGSVQRIKQHKFSDPDEFCQLVEQIEGIRKWFTSNMYKMIFDSVPGKERLQDIDNEILVDAKWLNNQHRMKEEIRGKQCLEKEEKKQEKHRRYRKKKQKIMAKERMLLYLSATPDSK